VRFDSSDVALIVPVGGTAPHWGQCAASVGRLEPAPGEIVAIIDGPNNDLVDTAESIGAKALQLQERGGPAKARNLGVMTSDRDILLFIDSDVEVPSDLTSRIAEIFSEDLEVAAVIGSYDDSPGDPSFLSQYRNLLHHFTHQQGRAQASTFWTGCGAIRREAFETLHGFDERYGAPSMEDIELGSRLIQAGYAIRLIKDLQVKHLKQWRLVDMFSTDLFRRAIPWTELILRQGELINDLNVKSRDRASVVAALVLLASLCAALFWPASITVAAVAVVLLLALNASFFEFLRRKRGVFFALGAAHLVLPAQAEREASETMKH
jgi:GT2 family glycosyltransferase